MLLTRFSLSLEGPVYRPQFHFSAKARSKGPNKTPNNLSPPVSRSVLLVFVSVSSCHPAVLSENNQANTLELVGRNDRGDTNLPIFTRCLI